MKLARNVVAIMAAAALVSLYGCGTSSNVTGLAPTTLDTTPPSVPEDLDLTTYSEVNILTWAPSTDADVAGYRVYQYLPDPGRDNAYVYLGQTSQPSMPVVSSSTDVVCSFRVKSIDATGNESAFSTEFTVTVPGIASSGGQGRGKFSEN